jgi:uncharacterized protein (DUF934 family)
MILDGEIVDNGWQRFEPGQLEENGQSLPENQPVIVPLAYWQAHRDTLLEREAPEAAHGHQRLPAARKSDDCSSCRFVRH